MSFSALFQRKALLLIAAAVVAVVGVGLFVLIRAILGGVGQMAAGGVASAVGLGIVPIVVWVAAFAFALSFKRSWLRTFNLWISGALVVVGLIGMFAFYRPLSGPLAWFSGYGHSTLGGSLGDAVIGGPGWFGGLRAFLLFALAFAVALPSLVFDVGRGAGSWALITFAGIGSLFSRKRDDDALDDLPDDFAQPNAPIERREYTSMRRDMWGSALPEYRGRTTEDSRAGWRGDLNVYEADDESLSPAGASSPYDSTPRGNDTLGGNEWEQPEDYSASDTLGMEEVSPDSSAAGANEESLYGNGDFADDGWRHPAMADSFRDRFEFEKVSTGSYDEPGLPADDVSSGNGSDGGYNGDGEWDGFEYEDEPGSPADDVNGDFDGDGEWDRAADVPSFLMTDNEPYRQRPAADAFENTRELILDDVEGEDDDSLASESPWDTEPALDDDYARGARADSGRKLNRYWLPEGAGALEPDLVSGRVSRRMDEQSRRTRPAADMSDPFGDSRDGDGMLWRRPPIEIFDDAPENPISQAELDETSEMITQTLANYNVEVEVGHVRPGPTVTMYGLVPGWVRKNKRVKQLDEDGKPLLNDKGKQLWKQVEEKTRVKVSSIMSLEQDLSLALRTPALRIETPAMGKSLVGIEVPNPTPSMVAIRNVMTSNEFQKLRKSAALPVALGRGSGGEAVCFDLAKMPHLLVAGATGSGKSVCLNAIVSCIITEKTPTQARLLLVDPKRVELTPYNGIPHLMAPVIVETDTVVSYLKGLIREMFNRYRMMEEVGARNIEAYNSRNRDKMPYLCVVIDELADLMMTAATDVEQSLCRLAQLGRATGIHLIIATQRPSVDVVTGLIKANFPSRISFGVTSQVDSRTILDTAGADKLLGRGDMLYLPLNASKPSRVQSVFIGDDEIGELVNFWQKKPWPPLREIDLLGGEDLEGGLEDEQASHDPNRDDMLNKAIELAQTHRKLSTSLLQRRLRIGYPRAARLMDQLEDEGIVGPADGAKSRDVIINQS